MRRTQPALSFVAPHVLAYPELSALSAANSVGPGGGSGRIRVGFVSSFFHTHTLMQLFLGVIEGLDPAVFEVIVLDISSRPADAVTERVRRAASKYGVIESAQPVLQERFMIWLSAASSQCWLWKLVLQVRQAPSNRRRWSRCRASGSGRTAAGRAGVQ